MSDVGTVLNIVSLGVSLVALALSSFIAWRQAQLMRHANIFPILIDFFREFRSPEFRIHQLYVRTRLADELPQNGIYGLPEPALGHVVPVLHYFDNLGALVTHGVVETKLALSILGESVERNWRLLAPFLHKEREIRKNDEYGIFFEHLAALAKATPGRQARSKLHLRRYEDQVTPSA
jgi:hypothetical protein